MNTPQKPGAEAGIMSQNAWIAVCAKIGAPEAANVRPGGDEDDLHEQRKNVRRAINKIRGDKLAAEFSDEEYMALDHGSRLVARIETMLDTLSGGASKGGVLGKDEWRNADGRPIKVMRNAEDFRAHYRDNSGPEMGLDDFLRGVAGMSTTTDVRAALSVGTDSSGGYTVPSLVMPQILEALAPASSLLQAGAGIVDLTDGGKTFTTAALNALPTAAWRSEGGSVSESDPTFRAVVATPRSLAFLFKVSRELLADSANMQQALRTAIAQAFAKELDRAGLRGSGTPPEPRGILNTSGIQSVTNGANGASQATLRYANIMTALQSILAADAPTPTAAIMSPRSLVGFGNLADTTNQPLMRPEPLKDMRFIATSQIPNNLTVGTSTDCTEVYVGNFSGVVFAFRERMSVQLATELYAATGQVGFICHVRADVMVQYPAALAVVTGLRP